MNQQSTQDQNLWRQFKAGNLLAFSTIFDQQVPGLIGYGRTITDDESLVEDCIQDLFVTLWERRTQLGKAVSIRPYLHSSLRRKLLRQLKRRRKTGTCALDRAAEPQEASYEQWLLQRQSNAEVRDALHRLMNQLTPQQKRIMMLKFYEHLSYDEIAALLHLNKRTVYNTCSAAIKHLQRHVQHTPVLRTLLSSAISWLVGVVILFG